MGILGGLSRRTPSSAHAQDQAYRRLTFYSLHRHTGTLHLPRTFSKPLMSAACTPRPFKVSWRRRVTFTYTYHQGQESKARRYHYSLGLAYHEQLPKLMPKDAQLTQ
ncbi:hypothetical protein GWK47_018986 [Chionoecetes opilio]|uniref:Uncharacterized protein n=1 Tax=Chionoecetes opilio TaxID=41210 RepID=A0A8J4XR65_CHIOP|nr:hypothetical protein GWK47_018983 [Chionoecetes opilio]KAG0712210.1 hypothetical protein GWK47_018986 [Chionoecetes opilio]